MTGVPGFKERQGRSVADLANDDAVGAQPHRALQQPGHIHRVAGMQANRILRRALDLGCILKDNEPVLGRVFDDLREDRIRERRLPRSGSAGDDDVQLGLDGAADHGRLARRHCLGANIVV